MNVLLITPWEVVENRALSSVPVGTAYINAALRNSGFNVVCFAFLGENNPEEIVKNLVLENKIDVVCCGGLTFQYKAIKRVFDIAKQTKPSVITIGGGGGFTAEPILFTEMCGADYSIIGEGDFSTPELLMAIEKGEDVSNILGVVYKNKEDNYCFTGSREAIENLDDIPFPSYEGFPIQELMNLGTPLSGFNTYYSDEPKIMNIVYSRSCPFKCSFCFHPTGDKYRTRSMDNFFAELDMYVNTYDIDGIALIDECFRMDDSVFEFCERIKKYNLKWVVSLVAKTVTPEKLRALKEAGCCTISYGIESMSEKVLKDMHKPADREVIERALKMTVAEGISVQGNLIFGAEAETIDTVNETLKWWLTHREYQLALNIVTPYPGSLYYQHCVERGIIKDKRKYIEDGCPWVNMSHLTDHQFERLINLISMPVDAKIAWDYACYSEIVEEKPNYKGNEQLVSMKLKCYHCGKVHEYGNLPREEVNSAFYMPCRSCGRLSTYGKKASFNYQLLTQWIKNESCGETVKAYIEKIRCKRIVIYGMGDLGCTLYTYLKSTNKVVGVTDKSKEADWFVKSHIGIEVTRPENINDLKPDLILVAPSYGKSEIINFLRSCGYEGAIDTLFDIVFGVSNVFMSED